MNEALEAFSSLSQETRLQVFKLLIEFGREGAVPSVLSEELDIPANTLSFHLTHLSRSGLVKSVRNGRSISYFANSDHIQDLIQYLHQNCCARETSSPKCTKGKEC